MRKGHKMRRVISTASKVLLVIVALPLAAIAELASTVFGLKAKLSSSEVATYLRNLVEGGGGEWDWDDFTSVPIAHPQLEDIRRRAVAVGWPPSEEGMSIVRGLLVEAEQMVRLEPQS